MSHRNLFAVACLVILLVLAIIASCGGGGSTPAPLPSSNCWPAGVNPSIVVSAATGSNTTANGTCAKPYKTISAAIASYVSGSTIWVAPGTYNAALGEVFPIIVPAGVALIGDEAKKGNGLVRTEILGNGPLIGSIDSTIEPLTGATIAGFVVSAITDSAPRDEYTIVVRSNSVTIRNNHIENALALGGGVYVSGASQLTIAGNIIQNNGFIGLAFVGGSGANSKIENNKITGQTYGIEIDGPSIGMDLGGGTTGSAGLNIISCNTANDIWTNTTGTISAMNNIWDHVPPTAADIFAPVTAPIITTGATVSTSPCL